MVVKMKKFTFGLPIPLQRHCKSVFLNESAQHFPRNHDSLRIRGAPEWFGPIWSDVSVDLIVHHYIIIIHIGAQLLCQCIRVRSEHPGESQTLCDSNHFFLHEEKQFDLFLRRQICSPGHHQTVKYFSFPLGQTWFPEKKSIVFLENFICTF